MATAGALVAAGLGVAPAQAASASAAVSTQASCGAPTAGAGTCDALQRTGLSEPPGIKPGGVTPLGLGPADLQSAYNLTAAAKSGGQTVAVVDAYNDPSAESDLAVYRAQYGLPACTTANGCFTKVNQRGAATPLPKNDGGWSDEISLDVDMVSAACPNCKILLIETDSASLTNLYAAVNLAVKLGAKFVSNGWGTPEYSGETTDDAAFNHPGVAITASTGDDGDAGDYPATSRYVTAVGGTTLKPASGGRGWSETAWSGGASACSAYEPKPAWQGAGTKCATRAEADVSAVADPATGVSVYETYGDDGWQVYGGTSIGASIVAAAYALAGAPAADSAPASFPYAHVSALNDVTSGSDDDCGAPICTAGTGWDGPTGLGTPNGVAAFAGPSGPVVNKVTVTAPGAQTATVGTPFSLQVKATDSDPTQTLSYAATGLPAGLSIGKSSGLISGTPTKDGAAPVTVTATDGTGASGSASFTLTVSPAANTVTVTAPGDQSATVGAAFSLQVKATDSDSTQTLRYVATGLPDGLSIDQGTGLISGTPTAPGSSSVTVTVTDGTGVSGSASFTTTVSPAPNTVTVAAPGDQSATVGTAFSLQITATDSDTSQSFSYVAAGLPAGLSINKSTGLISGTPTVDGSFPVAVTATDGTGASGSASFTTTVSPAPNTVTVAAPGDQSATVGTAFSLQITATDSDPGQKLTYSATGLPDGLSIDEATGLISGTPTTAGSASITVTATDGTGISGSASFTTTVVAPNTVTVADPGAQTATTGTAFSLQIKATDSDPTETLSYAATGLPDGLTIDQATGLISGTPTTAGTPSTTVTATDSTGVSGSATFTTTVKVPNTVTVTDPGAQTATAGTAFSLQISATDSDPAETLSYAATGLPDGLTIDRASGLISGTPAAAGSASISVTATDSTGVSGSDTFAVTVKPACTPAQLLGNPGFETGSAAPWTTTPGVVSAASGGQSPHSGTYYAWMDGYGAVHTDTVSQTVTIPAACTKTTLSFWLRVSSAEANASTPVDVMTVKVGDTTLGTYSNLDKGTYANYTQLSFPLGAFAGQTVTLTFTGTEDSSLQTSFTIDDTAISTS